MATERLSMRKSREILRLKWVLGRSHREAERACSVGLGTVSETVGRARVAGLDWAAVERLTDDELEARLYPKLPTGTARARPDPVYLHTELHRPGVTLRLLHVEYLEQHPDGYGYTQFCEHYRVWIGRRRLSMRQVHRGGEKLYVDYAGKKPAIVDPKTGECQEVELFIGVLGASNYTFAEATLTQRVQDWIGSHTRCLQQLGGVPGAIVPDQLKSGVTRACRYEPGIQRVYEELAQHYGTVILPARPAHPRDKAKVEVGVQIAERWILARLRNQTFFSLDALNERIRELCDELNERVMRDYGESRQQLFARLDKPALKPLPAAVFSYGEWKVAKVNLDYHVEIDHHWYSVHYSLVHEEVEARATATTVEVFHRGQRVASHARSYERARHTTIAEHMPKRHQQHAEWSPSRFARWASTIGPKTEELVSAILAERPHPEHGYRSCLGILRLGKRYGPERLEAACQRALVVRARSFKRVESILKTGLDRAPLPETLVEPERPTTPHENIRGRTYYH
ncbi:MAG TPA: IS21 family transposase [Solirubrobacteraceae bacterium]|jgi:transposase|nr:IS21 family transposase [Solirubrobacteraceae bacterium]